MKLTRIITAQNYPSHLVLSRHLDGSCMSYHKVRGKKVTDNETVLAWLAIWQLHDDFLFRELCEKNFHFSDAMEIDFREELISQAAEAVEIFGEGELERFANETH